MPTKVRGKYGWPVLKERYALEKIQKACIPRKYAWKKAGKRYGGKKQDKFSKIKGFQNKTKITVR